MRQQRGLDGLEELQRRARDQQGVEHAPATAALDTASATITPAFEQRLLGRAGCPRPRTRSRAPRAHRHRGVGQRRGCVQAPVPGERQRHDDQRGERRREDAERDRRLPGGDADRDGDREAEARDRLEQHEAAVEPEPLMPGEVAAGEVARRVGERRADEDPVQRGRVVEQASRSAAAGRARRRGTASANPPWMLSGTRSGCPVCRPRARRSAIERDSSCSTGR